MEEWAPLTSNIEVPDSTIDQLIAKRQDFYRTMTATDENRNDYTVFDSSLVSEFDPCFTDPPRKKNL